MKITGIIAEYNPFHNGHAYQLQTVKQDSDGVVCMMSGSFVQRGTIAVTDKWTRARMALSAGADLVFELPVCYVLSSAEGFASGAVALFNATGVIDTLCFGSESGDIRPLQKAAMLLESEPEEISIKFKKALSTGMSYPSARQKAWKGIIDSDLLSQPNNILALEYLRALIRTHSPITATTIKRSDHGYHSDTPYGQFASASAIRSMMEDATACRPYLPEAVYEILKQAYDSGDAPLQADKLDTALFSVLYREGADYLCEINGITEGLQNRILSFLPTSSTAKDLIEQVKTKRYPYTRLERILSGTLLHLTPQICRISPQYVRVLGMNQVGAKILHQMKSACALPIITKAADFDRTNALFQKDVLATNLSQLCRPFGLRKSDFTTPPIIL